MLSLSKTLGLAAMISLGLAISGCGKKTETTKPAVNEKEHTPFEHGHALFVLTLMVIKSQQVMSSTNNIKIALEIIGSLSDPNYPSSVANGFYGQTH